MLTPTQRDILRRLAEGEVLWSSSIEEAWTMNGTIETRVGMADVKWLYWKGLIREHGQRWFPMQYRITPAGRAALAAAEGQQG